MRSPAAWAHLRCSCATHERWWAYSGEWNWRWVEPICTPLSCAQFVGTGLQWLEKCWSQSEAYSARHRCFSPLLCCFHFTVAMELRRITRKFSEKCDQMSPVIVWRSTTYTLPWWLHTHFPGGWTGMHRTGSDCVRFIFPCAFLVYSVRFRCISTR